MSSRQNQMHIAELVPQVSLTQGFGICNAEMLTSGQRFEHRQVGGARLVQPGQQRVDGAQPALWCDDEVRPAFTCARDSLIIGHGFERAHHGCPDGDDAPACRPC